MNLDESQRTKVSEWIGQGLKLSEIQNRLDSELKVRMTYMEVRMLVDDLKLTPKDHEPAKAVKSPLTAASPPPPATDSPEMLARLIEAGVNVFRLNMSHAPHDWARRVVADIRVAAAAHRRFVGIMMDTQGPAIRTGELPVPLELRPGEKFTLTVR